MKHLHLHRVWLALAWLAGWNGLEAFAQFQVVTDPDRPRVFAARTNALAVRVHYAGAQAATASFSVRLIQLNSATTIRIGDFPWKQMSLLPGQTILDVAQVGFPAVNAETRFLVQWFQGVSNVVGRAEALVYPTNLLARLKLLAGDDPLGVFDPTDEVKPLLRSLAVAFQDLVEDGTDKYRGQLAIFGPFESKAQMRASLKDDIRSLAKRGVAVVWLQPLSRTSVPLKPSFYVVREAEGAIVVAEHGLVAHLAERPEAQLNLLRLAEEALHPTPLDLPETESSN
jgi:hypothetical protein